MIWRHGDVIIKRVDSIPLNASEMDTNVLVEGEATGHAHVIEHPGTALIWAGAGELFLQVVADTAKIVHEEHAPVILPRGVYKFWQQREYVPRALRPQAHPDREFKNVVD